MELDLKKKEIFIRNLSYETTAEDLIELFQEVGPIKKGSVVLKDGASLGFGFIKLCVLVLTITTVNIQIYILNLSYILIVFLFVCLF